MLMTTDPGDLVLDPTCGSGTTAYVAEQWGRRWITIDTSRVPLALARQRLLTATFPTTSSRTRPRGPVGGFVYKRKQNNRGEEVGGIVPHITLKSIANNEPPPRKCWSIGPRSSRTSRGSRGRSPSRGRSRRRSRRQESTDGSAEVGAGSDGKFADRMLEVLRKSPVLRLEGNRTVTLKNIRPPAKSLSLSAEAIQTGDEEKPVAFAFGPENGAVTETLVHQALREANMKGYAHLYVIGFAIQPNARKLIDDAGMMGVPATYVQATPDLMMGDLLKSLRSSQIFSVCGLPEVEVRPAARWPVRGRTARPRRVRPGDDGGRASPGRRRARVVPRHRLQQPLLPRLPGVLPAHIGLGQPQEGTQRHLRRLGLGPPGGDHEHAVRAGRHKQIAVKVIDDRGNELLVVKSLPK